MKLSDVGTNLSCMLVDSVKFYGMVGQVVHNNQVTDSTTEFELLHSGVRDTVLELLPEEIKTFLGKDC